MLTLYSFGPNFGLVDPSSFVLKVDAFLRFNELDFKHKAGVNNLQKAPKGKLPFIEDEGELIADSQFIFEHLTKKYQLSLDSHLTDEQKAQAYFITKALDENLYWCMVYSRWLCPDTWPKIKQAFFGAMPAPLKWIVPRVAQKNVRANLKGHGIGRHSHQEILDITRQNIAALATLLGDKQYFFGDKISSLDAATFGVLAQFISTDIDNEFNQLARTHQNLVQYCQRILAQYYPDKT
ncbi:glutathione S-transferase family protein [Catenovulum sp. SM1970]|uniref:glutathione S-transferase family protein n=1 Tax=Marinifaba aquimaris TaxID=2741323 RepID=UPI0015719EE5|nr:glutathione S-transferase family protein [Marinifaba aquimaris]NTS78585.1 glutathione S-transferase family protein [Marinifaba aquimaris]